MPHGRLALTHRLLTAFCFMRRSPAVLELDHSVLKECRRAARFYLLYPYLPALCIALDTFSLPVSTDML